MYRTLSPRVSPGRAPTTGAISDDDPTSLDPHRLRSVVVIEDEPDVLELLCDLLRSTGYVAVGVADPRRLPDLVEDLQPDLFLVDLMLPQSSGIEVAQTLRQQGFAQTPMIAISAWRRMRRQAEDSELFQAILPKPFDVNVILDTIDRHTE